MDNVVIKSLQACYDSLNECVDAYGGCDHSVGICMCKEKQILERAKQVLEAAKEIEDQKLIAPVVFRALTETKNFLDDTNSRRASILSAYCKQALQSLEVLQVRLVGSATKMVDALNEIEALKEELRREREATDYANYE